MFKKRIEFTSNSEGVVVARSGRRHYTWQWFSQRLVQLYETNVEKEAKLMSKKTENSSQFQKSKSAKIILHITATQARDRERERDREILDT